MSYPFSPSKSQNGNSNYVEGSNITTEEIDEGSSILQSPSDKEEDDDSNKIRDISASRRSSLRTPKKQQKSISDLQHPAENVQMLASEISGTSANNSEAHDKSDTNNDGNNNNSIVSVEPKTPILNRGSKSPSRSNSPESSAQIQIMRTPSRRSSASNSRNSTPGRTSSRGSTPRRPTTPLILEAMEEAATPRRNRLLLTPTRNRSTSRYSPKDDLMMLGKLLFAERIDEPRKKRKLDSSKTSQTSLEEPLDKLYDFVTADKKSVEHESHNEIGKEDEPTNDTVNNDGNSDTSKSEENAKPTSRDAAEILRERDRLLESSISVDEYNDIDNGSMSDSSVNDDKLDDNLMGDNNLNDSSQVSSVPEPYLDDSLSPRKSILSSRLSIGTSIANDSNVAIPEAIIREEGAYGRDSSDDQEDRDDNHTSSPELSFANPNAGLEIDSMGGNEADDEVIDFDPDLSLLKDVDMDRPERLSFIPIRRKGEPLKSGQKNGTDNKLKGFTRTMGASIIKNICKVLLPIIAPKKLKSSKTLEVLDRISQEFFEQEINDLQAYARHDKRKRITAEDVKLLMHRSNLTPTLDLLDNESNSIESEILRLGSQAYDMEDFRVLERVLFSKQINKVSRERRKNERKLIEQQKKEVFASDRENYSNDETRLDGNAHEDDDGGAESIQRSAENNNNREIDDSILDNEIRTQDLDNLKNSIDIEIDEDSIEYGEMPEIPLAEDEEEEEEE